MLCKNVSLLIGSILICFHSVYSKSISNGNNSSLLISEYAKVAHWGSARSSQGQKPWTQRSDASVNYGQNLKNHRSYDTSRVPAVGEVQERFNPKPYFFYEASPDQSIPNKNPPNRSPIKISSSPNFDSPVYLPTVPPTKVLSLPVLPTVEPQPHEDPYTSPYSSYNPPAKHGASDTYLPPKQEAASSAPTESGDSYLPQLEYSTNIKKPSVSISNEGDMENHIALDDTYVHQMYSASSNKENPPGALEHDTRDHKEVILDHPPPGYEDSEPQMAPPPMSDHFPHYLYDENHSDHHVYHEVAKPVEQKRVSKPQYSYYYIGRKLWYVPLYFSVYFIIYVTFLILKSIARHKIQFKHDFVDHHSRESRQLTNDDLNLLHHNVSVALTEGKRKFPLIVM